MGFACTYLKNSIGDAAVVEFRDSIALRETYGSYYRHLKKVKYDFIFIETSQPSFKHDSEVIRQIHQIQPEAKIIICGPVVAEKAAETLNSLPVTAAIKGEYEKGCVRVVNGETGIIDFDFLSQDEMNSAPFPYYSKQYAHRYMDACPTGQLYPQAQVLSSRGCPFKCIFCSWPATMTSNDPDGKQKRTVRYYKEDYLESFLGELKEKYKYKCIYFDDDTFNLGDKHVAEVCHVMRKIQLPWSAMCRADTSSLSMWQEMRDSGCFGVKLGFESGCQDVIDNIVMKNLDLEKAREAVLEIHKLGMSVHGTFSYGLPGETQEQMQQTYEYIRSLPFDTYQESTIESQGGTPLDNILGHNINE